MNGAIEKNIKSEIILDITTEMVILMNGVIIDSKTDTDKTIKEFMRMIELMNTQHRKEIKFMKNIQNISRRLKFSLEVYGPE